MATSQKKTKTSETNAPKKDKAKSVKTSPSKSVLRETRKSRRLTQKTEGKKTQKQKQPMGYAPQSARITPAQGPMRAASNRTWFGPEHNSDRSWLLVDAAGQMVGRIASEIAMLLRGKHKASFTPNNDAGDFVVVINAEQVRFTAKKEEQKVYIHHTGYTSGIKRTTPARLRQKFPERILEEAVKGMVPRTPLGRKQMTKLKIYAGGKHPHAAQNPIVWNLRCVRTRA